MPLKYKKMKEMWKKCLKFLKYIYYIYIFIYIYIYMCIYIYIIYIYIYITNFSKIPKKWKKCEKNA